jgi:hypothetical protein
VGLAFSGYVEKSIEQGKGAPVVYDITSLRAFIPDMGCDLSFLRDLL